MPHFDQPYLPYFWTVKIPETRRTALFAYTFLGVRIQCTMPQAPFDQWTKDDFDRFKNFFTALRMPERF